MERRPAWPFCQPLLASFLKQILEHQWARECVHLLTSIHPCPSFPDTWADTRADTNSALGKGSFQLNNCDGIFLTPKCIHVSNMLPPPLYTSFHTLFVPKFFFCIERQKCYHLVKGNFYFLGYNLAIFLKEPTIKRASSQYCFGVKLKKQCDVSGTTSMWQVTFFRTKKQFQMLT